MRKLILWLTVITLSLVPSYVLCRSKSQEVTYVFLLDTSGSMVGRPDGKSPIIFPKVKESIREFLNQVDTGTNILVLPFDEGIHDPIYYRIEAKPADVVSVNAYIDSIDATGEHTWIYRSFGQAVDQIALMASASQSDDITIIYLFTDGLDNDRAFSGSMDDIVKHFSLESGDYTYLFFCTLGVQLPTHDKKQLEEHPKISVIEHPQGVVHPILQIWSKTPILRFGNLWQQEKATQSAVFDLHGNERLPDDLVAKARVEVPSALTDNGLHVLLRPVEFRPQETVALELELVNFNEQKEECRGTWSLDVQIETNYPLVFVRPNHIDLRFHYTPPVILNLRLPTGASAPLDFGDIDLSEVDSKSVSITKKVILDYGSTDDAELETIEAWWDPDAADNPSELRSGLNMRTNGEARDNVMLGQTEDELVLELVLQKGMERGNYSGTINFRGAAYDIQGKGVQRAEDDPTVSQLSWEFKIVRHLPLWQKVLYGLLGVIVLLLIADLLYYSRQGEHLPLRPKGPPRIPKGTKLEIRDPKPRRGEEIDISEMERVCFGEGGEHFSDVQGCSFEFRPKREGRTTTVHIVSHTGDISLRRVGESADRKVLEEAVFDGDTIKFDQYTLRISSFSLANY